MTGGGMAGDGGGENGETFGVGIGVAAAAGVVGGGWL